MCLEALQPISGCQQPHMSQTLPDWLKLPDPSALAPNHTSCGATPPAAQPRVRCCASQPLTCNSHKFPAAGALLHHIEKPLPCAFPSHPSHRLPATQPAPVSSQRHVHITRHPMQPHPRPPPPPDQPRVLTRLMDAATVPSKTPNPKPTHLLQFLQGVPHPHFQKQGWPSTPQFLPELLSFLLCCCTAERCNEFDWLQLL